MAGPSTSASESLPHSESISISPPGVPGVTAASGPYSGGTTMPFDLKNAGVAPVGATPRAFTPMTLFVFGLNTSACVSPPQLSVSHMVVVAASIAHAASTALPPFWYIIEPAVAASGLPVMATQWRPCRTGLADARAGRLFIDAAASDVTRPASTRLRARDIRFLQRDS